MLVNNICAEIKEDWYSFPGLYPIWKSAGNAKPMYQSQEFKRQFEV